MYMIDVSHDGRFEKKNMDGKDFRGRMFFCATLRHDKI